MIKRAIVCLIILAGILVFPETVLSWLLKPAEILTLILEPHVGSAFGKETLSGLVTVLWVFFLIYFFFRFAPAFARAGLDRIERYGEASFFRYVEGTVVEILLLFFVFFGTAVLFDAAVIQTWKQRERDLERIAARIARPEVELLERKATEDLRVILHGFLPFYESTRELKGEYHASLPRKGQRVVESPNALFLIPDGQQGQQRRDTRAIDAYNYSFDYIPAVVAGVNDYNQLEAGKRPALSSQFPPGTTIASMRATYSAKVSHWADCVSKLADTLLDTLPRGFEQYREIALKAHPELGLRPTWQKLLGGSAFITIPLSLAFWGLLGLCFRHPLATGYLSVSRFFVQGRAGSGGSSRFGRYFEEWEAAYNASTWKDLVGRFSSRSRAPAAPPKADVFRNDLFFGRSLYNPFLNIGSNDDRHMMTIAGSRTGKGTTAIIPNLLLWRGSAIVIDPKGTNAAVTARARREMGQTVHIVDPFGLIAKTPEEQACFNPLAQLNPYSPTVREEISRIADALVVSDPGRKDPHWDDGARTVLIGAIAHLIGSGHYAEPTLPMLRDLLITGGKETRTFGQRETSVEEDSEPTPEGEEHEHEQQDELEARAGESSKDDAKEHDPLDELWADMSINHTCGGAAKETAARMVRTKGTNEKSGILSSTDKHTEWLSFPSIHHTLSKSSFTFAEVKQRPTTIYLILPPKLLKTYNRLLRLFINIAIGEMSTGGKAEVPVLMVLDEFLALGYMREVEEAFGLMAGYNLVIWPFVQELGQLRSLYGNSVNAFITNSRAIQVFGVFDEASTKFVSDQLGPRRSLMPNSSSQIVPLRTHSEVALDISRQSGRQYIIRAGQAPLLLGRVPYFKGSLFGGMHKGLFAGKYDPDPDFADKSAFPQPPILDPTAASPISVSANEVSALMRPPAASVSAAVEPANEPAARESEPDPVVVNRAEAVDETVLPSLQEATDIPPEPPLSTQNRSDSAPEISPAQGTRLQARPYGQKSESESENPVSRGLFGGVAIFLLIVANFALTPEQFDSRESWPPRPLALDAFLLTALPVAGLVPAFFSFWRGRFTRTFTLILAGFLAYVLSVGLNRTFADPSYYCLVAGLLVLLIRFILDWRERRHR